MLLSIQDLKVAFRLGERGATTLAQAVKGVSFDIPEPDSPTSATVLLTGTSKLMPRTASCRSAPIRKATLRSRTSIREFIGCRS